MAMIDLGGGFFFPPKLVYDTGAIAFTAGGSTLDAADERLATIFQVPKTGDIRKVSLSFGTVTTGATLDVRLETVDATDGDPTDTLVGTDTNGALVVDAADDNTVKTVTLTADATVTIGQQIAVVVVNPNTSFGNMQVRHAGTGGGGRPHSTYNDSFNAAVWTKGVTTGPMQFALEYDDGTYVPVDAIIPPMVGSGGFSTSSITTATTPDVVGLRFMFPVSVRVRGFWLISDIDGDTAVRLVTTAYHQVNQTGILADFTLDNNIRTSNTTGMYINTFDARVDLAASTNYRLIVEPLTTSAAAVYDSETASLAMMGAFNGGSAFHFTTAKDPTGDGSWTNYNSGTFRVPHMGLIIDGFDDATGSVPAAGGVSRSRVQRGM